MLYIDEVMKEVKMGMGRKGVRMGESGDCLISCRSRVRAIQMDNLRGLLGIRMMDRIPNAQIRELCGVRRRSR